MKKVLAAIRRNGVEVATVFDQVNYPLTLYIITHLVKTVCRITLITTRTVWPVRQ